MNNTIDGKSWQYINLDEFEFKIRQEERQKEFDRRCSARSRRRKAAEEKHQNFKRSIPFRLIGMLLVIVTALLLKSNILYDSALGFTDGTFACITFPMGFALMLMPYQWGDDLDDSGDSEE